MLALSINDYIKRLPLYYYFSDSQVPGFCPNREGGSSDVAYQISSRTSASLPTAQAFPDQFPADFSILAAFKASPNSKSGWLLNIYSAEGDEIFSIKIGRKINMNYQGIATTSAKKIKFGASLNDGR
jgi:hypothetical protein